MLKPSQQTLPLESFMPVNDQIESLPYDDRYEIEKSKFVVCEVLGNGEYGKVYRGILKTQNGDLDVAVKTPRDTLNIEHHKALISELKIMIYVRQHVNVLRVLGACTKDIQSAGFYIITEYCRCGSLRDFFLRNRENPCSTCENVKLNAEPEKEKGSRYVKNLQYFMEKDLKPADKHCYVNVFDHECSYFTTETLLSFAYQSASGMEYLAAKNVVHRDLALRNLLLDGNIVKIADFGLSRHHRDVYSSRKFDCPLPVFWMALESIISSKYTEKSDVWSFGVVLWEIFSLGDSPYADKKPDRQFLQWLREGNRMSAPKLSPKETYDLMLSCWNKDPDTRPTFSDCKRKLGEHLDTFSQDAYRSLLLMLSEKQSVVIDPQLSTGSSHSTSGTVDHAPQATYAVVEGSNKENSSGQRSASSDMDITTPSTAFDSLSSSGDSENGENDKIHGPSTIYMAPSL